MNEANFLNSLIMDAHTQADNRPRTCFIASGFHNAGLLFQLTEIGIDCYIVHEQQAVRF